MLGPCLIPNRWVCALPPPSSVAPRLLQGPQKAAGASWGDQAREEVQGLLGEGGAQAQPFLGGCSVLQTPQRPRLGGPLALAKKQAGPGLPWCTPLSQPMVTSKLHRTLRSLDAKTLSPGVKHMDSEPSCPSLNPNLPGLCWAPPGKSLNLSVPFSLLCTRGMVVLKLALTSKGHGEDGPNVYVKHRRVTSETEMSVASHLSVNCHGTPRTS